MTRLTERIASNIRRLRDEADWSQEALAREAAVSTKTVSRLENNETDNPRKPELERIAKALGTTVDGLMGLEDDPEPSTRDDGEPADEELNSEYTELMRDSDILVAFMGTIRDPKDLSRAAKLALLAKLRKARAQIRRQG